jgi:hypothetical protein
MTIINSGELEDTLGPAGPGGLDVDDPGSDWQLRFSDTDVAGLAGERPLLCNDDFPGIGGMRCFLANVTGGDLVNGPTDHYYPTTVGAEPQVDVEVCTDARNTYSDYGQTASSTGCVDADGGGQDKDWENDFIVEWATDLENPDPGERNEIPGIIVGEDGAISLYLDVVPLGGASENGWLVWAGPRPRDYPGDEPHYVPSEVNARNMFLYNLLEANPDEYANWHGSEGIAVGSQAPPTYDTQGFGTTHIPLLYVPPQMGGQEVTVEIFDAENDPGPGNDTRAPLYFHFDTVPVADWSACFDDKTGIGSGNPDGWPCDIAPFEGSNEETYTPVDLSGFYVGLPCSGGVCVEDTEGNSIGNAYIDFYGLNPSGGYDGVRRAEDGFISYTFTLPTQINNPPFGDVFRGGMLYASLWAGWTDTYALRITVGGGSPVLVE